MIKAKDKVTINGMSGQWEVVTVCEDEIYVEALDPNSHIILNWVDITACEKVK